MSKQQSQSDVVEGEPAAEDAEAPDDSQGARTLFWLADDPFVNEAATEIGRQLANEGLAEITPTRIQVAEGIDIERAATWIERLFEQALENTHRRTTVAHQVNAALEGIGGGPDDDRWVPSPNRHFPGDGDEDLTAYPDDEVDIETVEANGIPHEKVEYVDDDSSALYQLSPIYVGNPSGHKFGYQIGRQERYLQTYVSTITGEFEPDDHPCMLCGSEVMPTTKGVEGGDLEFNQSFNIRSTASGVSVPLGMGSRDTAHQGRCVACLVAGFYYTLMPKVVRLKDRETCGGSFPILVHRIFAPRGDFQELVEVRGDLLDLMVPIDSPTENDRARQGNLPAVRTQSRGLQTLQFYESVLRYINREETKNHYNFAVEYRPTALISYTSARQKSGRPVRDIREVESIDPGEWAYAAVRQRSVATSDDDGSGVEDYWPSDDLLSWYARLDDVSVQALDNIGYGILERNLKRLANGHFEVAKSLERNQGSNAPYVLPIRRADHYFTSIMQHTTPETTNRIEEEAIESIKRVASSIGETFHERDDISVLIGLQNASAPDEFLQAFEKASMQAQKKASTDEQGGQSWSGKNDVAEVLKLINDQNTFEPAKRMFVIHASLAAQYMNAQRSGKERE